MSIVPVILSGGSGTRLWPLSTSSCPKQFLPLMGQHTMIQETLLRLSGIDSDSPIVICNERHRFIVAEQLSEMCSAAPSIMLEPLPKNTAPAIAVGAFQAMKRDENAVMIVLPSDHIIKKTDVFQNALNLAVKNALDDALVTFGIVPDSPHTGYGYIQKGNSIHKNDSSVFKTERFVEKPDSSTAKAYLASGDYFWNSGMFVFKASVFLSELQRLEPEMYALSKAAFDCATVDTDFIRIDKDNFEKIAANSIDYAVMEKTDKGRVIPLDAGWNDVGSWASLYDINEKDACGNVQRGKAIFIDSKKCYVNSKKTIALIGLEDVIVVEGEDAILVSKMERSQDVKKAAEFASAANS